MMWQNSTVSSSYVLLTTEWSLCCDAQESSQGSDRDWTLDGQPADVISFKERKMMRKLYSSLRTRQMQRTRACKWRRWQCGTDPAVGTQRGQGGGSQYRQHCRSLRLHGRVSPWKGRNHGWSWWKSYRPTDGCKAGIPPLQTIREPLSSSWTDAPLWHQAITITSHAHFSVDLEGIQEADVLDWCRNQHGPLVRNPLGQPQARSLGGKNLISWQVGS